MSDGWSDTYDSGDGVLGADWTKVGVGAENAVWFPGPNPAPSSGVTMSDVCFRPKGLCCRSLCSHPPECDHDGYGTDETPWRRMFSGGQVVKEYPGGVFCLRCGWWLRESARPADWPEPNPT